MTDKEIIENNELICDFFQVIKIKPEESNFYRYQPFGHVWYNPEQLKFNSDWNWLILIIEYIESLNYKDGIEVCIDRNECEISTMGYVQSTLVSEKVIIDEYGNNKIEAVWLAVIEFIKWWNNKNEN